MKVVAVTNLKARLSEYLRDSAREPVIVTRHGKPVAVLLSMEDEDELERLVLTYSPKFRSVLAVARKQIRKGGGTPHEDFWAEVEAGDDRFAGPPRIS